MLKFSKMNGNGNDFLVLDNRSLEFSTQQLVSMTLKLCQRRQAIGADGILVVEPSKRLAFKMRLFNRDGSEGEMCGNGARCIARYAFEEKIAGDTMCFETLGGDQHATVNGRRVALQLAPISEKDVQLNRNCTLDGQKIVYNYLTVGVPHVVIFESDVRQDEEYFELGKKLRNSLELFPRGANINFAVKRKDEENGYTAVTYERGVEALTLSCGTGCTSIAIAAYLTGLGGKIAEVHNPGGTNRIIISEKNGIISPLLEGLTVRVGDVFVADEMLS